MISNLARKWVVIGTGEELAVQLPTVHDTQEAVFVAAHIEV